MPKQKSSQKMLRFNKNTLTKQIQKSHILTLQQKEEFLKVISLIPPQQLLTISSFFISSEKSLLQIEKKYAKQKSLVYEKYMNVLKQAVQQAKGLIRKYKEKKSIESDVQTEEKLLRNLKEL